MPAKPQFAAVDWGTSSFRLWLIGEDDTVLAETRSAEGMTTARETGFAAVLARHLQEVRAPEGLPVIVCGMAGAKQGWKRCNLGSSVHDPLRSGRTSYQAAGGRMRIITDLGGSRSRVIRQQRACIRRDINIVT